MHRKTNTLIWLCLAIAMGSLGGDAVGASKLEARVVKTASGPVLYVNGKPTAPTFFFANIEVDEKHTAVSIEEVRTAGKHGLNLLSLPMGVPWPEAGKEPDFGYIDRPMDRILKANPNALIIPRMGVTWPSEPWKKAHPDDLMLYDDGSTGIASLHSRLWRREAAQLLKAYVKHVEEKYGDHVLGYHPSGQNTGEWFLEGSWEARLTGFEPVAREAFRNWLKSKYGSDKALQAAWDDPKVTLAAADVPSAAERKRPTGKSFVDPAAQRRVIDFLEFQNAETADAVEEMCAAIKAEAPHKLAVVFYGYHFELGAQPFGPQNSGHMALGRLLKSPNVDVICAPVSYMDRQCGGAGSLMAPIDSVALHGKLWLSEDDTRTHLGENDAEYGLGHTANARETYGVLARNFANVATRGAAEWWMDLFGHGWFSGDDICIQLAGLQASYRQALPKLEPYRPEIAVIVDEESSLYFSPSRDVPGMLLAAYRAQWNRIGAPVGVYLLDDLVAGKVPPARMYVFLNAFRLSAGEVKAVRKHACRKGCVVVWMYAQGIAGGEALSSASVQDLTSILITQTESGGGRIKIERDGALFDAGHAHLSPMFAVTDKDAKPVARYADGGQVAVAAKKVGNWTSVYCGTLQLPASVLRTLARQAGVHIYSDFDDAVAAGNGFVSLHASSSGPRTLRMCGKCSLTDVGSGVSAGPASEFAFDMNQGDTKLFRVEYR